LEGKALFTSGEGGRFPNFDGPPIRRTMDMMADCPSPQVVPSPLGAARSGIKADVQTVPSVETI